MGRDMQRHFGSKLPFLVWLGPTKTVTAAAPASVLLTVYFDLSHPNSCRGPIPSQP